MRKRNILHAYFYKSNTEQNYSKIMTDFRGSSSCPGIDLLVVDEDVKSQLSCLQIIYPLAAGRQT